MCQSINPHVVEKNAITRRTCPNAGCTVEVRFIRTSLKAIIAAYENLPGHLPETLSCTHSRDHRLHNAWTNMEQQAYAYSRKWQETHEEEVEEKRRSSHRAKTVNAVTRDCTGTQ